MKPSIKSPCVAEKFNPHKWSRIAEFSAESGSGLIIVANWTIDGAAFTRVTLEQLDKDVRVSVNPDHLELSDFDWQRLEAIIAARKSSAELAKIVAGLAEQSAGA